MQCPNQQTPRAGIRRGGCSTLWATVVAICLLFVPIVSFSAEWFYTLRPGDTLPVVAEKFCGDATYADRISKHNNLDQRIPLSIGSRIRIPVDWLVKRPAPARVVSVTGEVTRADGTPLVVGDALNAGQALRTGKDALSLVQFADGSTLEISAQASVVFDVLSAYGDAGMVDTLVRFQRGRGVARVIKQEQGARFRVSTPTGIAAVRGTEFRVAAQDEQALVETTEGSIGFEPGQQSAAVQVLVVDAGYGVVATPTGAQREELLPAPNGLAGPPVPSRRASFSWDLVQGAERYEITLYAVDTAGSRPIDAHSTQRRSYRTPPLTPGTYEVSVRGVAASGLQGMDAKAQAEIVDPPGRPWWMLAFLLPILVF